MLKTNGNDNPMRPPWYRLHLPTWLVLPLGLVVAVLIVLPGGPGRYQQRELWMADDSSAIVHGWPLPYAWRTPAAWTGDPAKATPFLPWKLADSLREFRVLPLIIDLAAAAIGIGVLAILVEWRRRRRTRAFQFSVRELLIFVPLVAITAAWLANLRATDLEVAARLSRLDGSQGARVVPRFPLWLRTMVGDDRLSVLGFNTPRGPFIVEWNPSRQQDIQYIVRQFPRQTVLGMYSSISAEDATAIAAIDGLEQIECCNQPPGEMTTLFNQLAGHPQIRNIRLVGGREPIDDTHLSLIASFPQLESLVTLQDADKLTAQGITQLEKCTNLKELELERVRLTKDTLIALGKLKQVRRLDLSGAQLMGTDLSALCRLDGLEDLDLSAANLEDADARQLRTLPHLRSLHIASTQISARGVRELLDPSPNFVGRSLEEIRVDADMIDDGLIPTLKRLPRLRRIAIIWDDQTRDSQTLPQLISQMQRELPGCDVTSHYVMTINF